MLKTLHDPFAVLSALGVIGLDSLFVFDENHALIDLNDQAFHLLGSLRQDLLKKDIKDLFYPLSMQRLDCDLLPFPTDGTGVTLFARRLNGSFVPVEVHCLAFYDLGEKKYLMAVRSADMARENERERERLVRQLRRANTRLEGLLEIISSTLGQHDFHQLINQVLVTLTDVMEADSALFYLKEELGYRLTGSTQDKAHLKVGRYFIDVFQGVPGLVDKNRALVALEFLPDEKGGQTIQRKQDIGSIPTEVNKSLRGSLRHPQRPSQALNTQTGEQLIVYSHLPEHYRTAVGIPLFSTGDTLVGVILLMWTHKHKLIRNDLVLLERVSDYLSVEFASALSMMRHRKREQITYLLSSIRDQMYSADTIDNNLLKKVIDQVQEEVPFHFSVLKTNPWNNMTVLEMNTFSDNRQTYDFPFKAGEDYSPLEAFMVTPADKIGAWLSDQIDLKQGYMLHLGDIFSATPTKRALTNTTGTTDFLAYRRYNEAPFEEVELEFLQNLSLLVRKLITGERERTKDTRISQALQLAMKNELPTIDGITSAGLYSSATEQAVVGGDYFDVHELNDHKVLILMGDISGKGVEAASMASLVKTAVAAYAWNHMNPAEIVQALNKLFFNFSRVESFTTLFLTIVDLVSRKAMYCCAGHPPAFLYQRLPVGKSRGYSPNSDSQADKKRNHPSEKHGFELQLLTVQSPIVGAFEEMKYTNGTFTIHEGDILYLYTDGTTEARSQDGTFFGEEALRDLFLQVVDQGVENLPTAILRRLESFSGGALMDDVAMVAVQFNKPLQATEERIS